MPNYNFTCSNCGNLELFMSFDEYEDFKCRCPQCHCKVDRDYQADRFVARDDSSGMTLGTYAERATAKMGDDEQAYKKYKQNEYKYNKTEPDTPLPNGMTWGKDSIPGKLHR